MQSNENNELEENILIDDNDTLLISEIQEKVFFPYSGKEIEELLSNNPEKYNSVQDVINENFIRPIKDFKDLHRSRAKETFILLTQRENYSGLEALDLTIEMFRKRYLHPAIIAACRTLNELNVYLDCLEKNELDDFKIFNIKYEVYPMKVKNKPFFKKQ